MHIHFIVHEVYEGPGVFKHWVAKNGFHDTYTHLYLGEQIPETLDFDLLVILGGPQSPSTTVEECAHFNVDNEIRLINQCIASGKAVLGVCLGAQLIGEALGAKCERSPHKEIGYFPITLTTEGRESELLQHFQSSEVVGHWHGDMPGLLPTSKVLAYSEGCPRQIIEYSDMVYGFQCHLELNKECVQGLIAEEVDLVNDNNWVQDANEIMMFDTSCMNDLLFQFLDGLVEKYKQHQ